MRNFIIISVMILAFVFIANETKAQSYTAPQFTFGLALNGNFAMNDFYGTNLRAKENYGAIWGRGIMLYGKYGLGQRKNHRLIASIGYDKMVNDNEGGKAIFFVTSPDTPHTFYDIITGTVGYEYVFNARCKNRQYIGLALSLNSISAPAYSTRGEFKASFRLGLVLSAGYELVLDPKNKFGLNFGLKYNLINAFSTDNSTSDKSNFNDGSRAGGTNWWRRLGLVTLNVGFNIYHGQKLLIKK